MNDLSAEDLASTSDYATLVSLTDSAEAWADYAEDLRQRAIAAQDDALIYYTQAYYAGVNAYLRGDSPALRHSILVGMAAALEGLDRGRLAVPALQLAQSLQARDDTAAALDRVIGLYGFRMLETQVQSDSPRPRICVTLSEPLAKSGVDYTNFVQLSDQSLTVSSDGDQQLCIEGVQFGSRNSFTLRAGLPAADGQTLAKSVEVTAYVRDRKPSVRFAGRGYVLPRGQDQAIPVETVNTENLDLTLFKISDRNMLRALQDSYFGAPMNLYQEQDFSDRIGAEIWRGTGLVRQEVNVDVTTRLPLGQALNGQPAGIYALRAAVPGVDPYDVPASWQWFVISDLGLTTLSGTDGLHVFVRSLGTAAAKPGVSVQLLSAANEVLGAAVTDDQGYARFEAALALGTGGHAPALIVATAGSDDIAFLSLTDPEFDLSDRGVAGREAAPPVDVFLTTDRGAYRAGETIYATALTRDSSAKAIVGLPLTAILRRPDGVEYSRAQMADAGAGGHIFALPVAGSAPRGLWSLAVFADLEAPALQSKTVLVEDFLPERIDFSQSLPDAAIRLGDSPEMAVAATYLFGAAGADLAVEGEVLLRAAKGLEAWPRYVFGREDTPFSPVQDSFGGIKTDATGQALIALPLPQIDDPARPLEVRVTTRIAEGSGRPVERSLTRLLAPSSDMIGIKPLFDGVVAEASAARFDLIAIGADLAPVPMQVTWTLTRIETNYQWYQSGGSWNWEPVTSRKRVAEGQADLGDTATSIAAAVDWGQYELVVSAPNGPSSSTRFYAGWYAPADTSDSPDVLEMSLDKPAYASGETAMLRVVPKAEGTALITVLSNRLVAMQTVAVAAGENLIPLPVSADWGAGAYVTVQALRPMDVAAGRNPARALGLTYASIDPGPRALKTTIETAPEADPRGSLDVAVKVQGIAAGETAFVTIAAVDQGILNLTAYTPPDPQGHYFGQRKLGVGIRDLYGRLIDAMSGAMGETRSGGDAAAQARLQAPPPTEDLVANFTGPNAVGADGYARASFTLPSFNGTVKVMVVAWSNSAIGQANADVLVRDPVVVSASLPRFLQPGDQSRMLLEIIHASGPAGEVGLSVTSNGLTLGAVPDRFDLAQNGKAVFAVPLTAHDLGDQTIEVALTTPDGKLLRKTLTVPVRNNDPAVARVSRFALQQGQSLTLDASIFAGLTPETATATLVSGPVARLNAAGLLAALDRYPYGCTEQITSKALPLLYFNDLAQALQLQGAEDLTQRIQGAIADVLTNQASNGAFGLWGPVEDGGDMWLDAYVTDFLSRAKAMGYAVPDQAFRSALDNLRNQVNYSADFDKGGEGLAYALLVLAREGAAAVGDLRYYADVKGAAFATPMAMAQLGAALASYGDQPRADAMFRRAGLALQTMAGPETEQIFRADYGTGFRDAAAVLTLATEAGSKAVDRSALTDRIVTNLRLSTQEAVWSLLAAHALLQGSEAGQGQTGATVTDRIMRRLTPSDGPLILQNDGKDTNVTLTTMGVPNEPVAAGGTGYAISRSYYSLDGVPLRLEALRVGERFTTVLTITPFGRGEARLMINDPLPAGFEIDNPTLLSSASEAMAAFGLESDVTQTQFRQDRFLAAIDRSSNQPFKLGYVLRAISPGVFHLPAATVEDMYRPDLTGRSDAGSVTIAE
ncbi:alpha-2-macroglobulin [Cypionkella sp.]|uniref:alpha-2-macroglobulin family protein n=1 Tax=Cypionkella sp. TaxID=2811411 RepID=UPI002758B082|nr:alpha-2-macroglobulin family protein [Cypionkella sp.]